MLKTGMTLVLGLAIAAAAMQADARASHGASSPSLAIASKECHAKCKSDYQADLALCAAGPSDQTKACRRLRSAQRRQCDANCP